MILCISLVIDMVLLTLKAVRKRNPTECLRFLSMSMIVNAIAYYMLLGLTRTFGYSLLLALVCCAAAKIFVVWFYLQAAEGKGQNIPAYLLAILLSLCPHADPIPGLISEAILLVYVVYRERREKAEPTESPDTHIRKESDIYLKTIEESYRKNRALMHDLKNHIIVLRSGRNTTGCLPIRIPWRMRYPKICFRYIPGISFWTRFWRTNITSRAGTEYLWNSRRCVTTPIWTAGIYAPSSAICWTTPSRKTSGNQIRKRGTFP